MQDKHISSAFDRDLEGLQALIMKMGGLVETSIRNAADALMHQDEELAQKVRQSDKAIDALEEEINLMAARIIALRSPVASDLRTVLSVMKISANIERCGDYAKNMAKRTGVLVQMPEIDGASKSIRRMARDVDLMLKDALDAFVRRDPELAESVRECDDEVDQMYNTLFREFLTFMMEDPRNITACMHYHFIAKNVERMGDHITSIAEQVIYLVTGELPTEARSKSNTKPYEIAYNTPQ